MSKNQNRVVVTRACKFGKDDVRNVRFVATKTQVKVTCKSKPSIIIKVNPDKTARKSASYLGWTNDNEYVASVGATPEKAYRKLVREFWL